MRRILSVGLLLVCASARAADLYVPAEYPTIAGAVAAAHLRTDGSTTIHIAPGVYPESGIVLDVSNLTLAGTTPPARGADGFLTDFGSQTLALVGTNLPVGAFVFQVKAANVRITGLALQGLHPIPAPPPTAPPGSGGVVIAIDGALSPADGFSIEGNIVMGEGFGQGITSRMASGTIQGNRITLLSNGSAVFGGRPEDAKTVAYRDNLVIANTNVGAAFQGGNGSRTSSPPAADGPGHLSVEVSGNGFRGNGSNQFSFANVGLSFLLNDNTRSDTTQPARIDAYVHDNSFIENRNWGMSVAQRVNLNVPQIGFEFEGTFERNRYCGNGLNAAIVDFRQVTTTIGGNVLRYARGSKYVIHAENDPLGSIGFDLDHPANDPDAHDYPDPIPDEEPGVPLGNTLYFNGAIVPTVDAPVLQRTTPMVGCPDLQSATLYLRGTGLNANPSVLFLDLAPTASTPKYRDSAGISFAGGNAFKEIGTWKATPPEGSLTSAGDLRTWIGLKNSDDQGTRFDLRAELYNNGMLVAEGLTRCIQNVTTNPNLAREVAVPFGTFPATVFTGSGTDVLSLKVLTRIGTNPDGSSCGGHANATGLRLYFDSTNRPSSFDQNP